MTAPLGVTLVSMADLLARPELLRPPTAVIPRLAWAGRVTLLAGREKDGKSTLAAAGCAALSAAGAERPSFLGELLNPGLVAWLSADAEAEYDQLSRLRRFGAEPANIWFARDWDRTPASFLRAILDNRPAVAVIDTLAAFAELTVADAGSASAWTPLMLAIKRAANEAGTAIVLVHHAAKGTGRYRDSTDIGAGVDAILELEPSEDGSPVRRVRARAKWPMTNFAVRLDGDAFTLDEARVSLDAQILAHIEAHPGLAGAAVRSEVRGRPAEIVAALHRLNRSRLIENQGTSRKAAWYRVGADASVPLFRPVPGTGAGAAVPASVREAEQQALQPASNSPREQLPEPV